MGLFTGEQGEEEEGDMEAGGEEHELLVSLY